MTKAPEIFLQSILDSVDLIERRMKGVTLEKLENDVDLQDMVIRRLELIGEAVRQLPKDFRQNNSHINWKQPAAMRSMLIHNYLDADITIVWDTIENDLQPFKEQIKMLLTELNN